MNENHTISENAGLLEALGRLNALSGSGMTLFALDNDGRVVGTLTDGDIRRALIGGVDCRPGLSPQFPQCARSRYRPRIAESLPHGRHNACTCAR